MTRTKTTFLTDEEDAFGDALLDHLDGKAGEMLLERDDGHSGPALPAAFFFAEHGDWSPEEQEVFERVRGRVLDVGCGAGRHCLEAARRGLAPVGIDISPGRSRSAAAAASKTSASSRSQTSTRASATSTPFSMLCGNFGLVGAEPERILTTLCDLTTPCGRIVLDLVDPYVDSGEADLAYQERNRVRGLPPGQVTIRLRYRDWVIPWSDLLLLSVPELEEMLAASGWRLARVVHGRPADYYAVAERAPG